MNLWSALTQHAGRDGLAVDAPDARLTYPDLIAGATTAASDLTARGLKAGDRVAYLGFNSAALLVLIFAAARLGVIIAPLNWRLAADELAWIISDMDPRLIVTDDSHADVVARIAQERTVADAGDFTSTSDDSGKGQAPDPTISDDAPLLLVYTSGTTGRPKGAMLCQAAVLANARLSWDMHDMTASDRVLTGLPMFHVGGLNIQTLPALLAGATVAVMDRFEPAACLDLIATFRPTLMVQVPATMQALMSLPDWDQVDLGCLRAISTGSTDVPVSLIQAVHDRGVPMIQIYGATETGPVVIYQKAQDAASQLGSIGRAGPGVHVRIMTDGTEADKNTPGEIWLQSPTLATGYWRGQGDEAFSDGWFRTGDVARQDANGFLWFTDRLKNVVISGGENIYPAELERVLRDVPGVIEAAVVGRPDQRWGAVPVAVIVGQVDVETVKSAFQGRLARFKHPKDVVFIDALPRNAMGKVDTAAVRQIAAKT